MTYTTTTMSDARANFAELLDNASKQVTVIKRRGKSDVAVFDIDLIEDILSLSDKKLILQITNSRKNDKHHTFREVFGDL